MNKAQRIVLIAYCLLVVYCCVWVPWMVREQQAKLQQGYDWVWAVGCEPPPSGTAALTPDEQAKANRDGFVMVEASPCHGFKEAGLDVTAIGLRLAAATALAAAAFLLAGNWKRSATRI